ncbi:MAG TPA: hypothetical protein DEF13_03690 [Holosporales bacterium]|nr:hypothetical protein [Holosporales bacterium]
MIHESSETRSHFKIDVEKDPFVRGSQEIMNNPLEAIGGKGTKCEEKLAPMETGDESFTCEETGEEAEYTCKSYLLVTLKEDRGPPQQGSLEIPSHTLYEGRYGLKGLISRGSFDVTAQAALKQYISSRIGVPSEQVEVSPPLYLRQVTEYPARGWTYTYSMYRIPYTYHSLIKVPQFAWDNRCGALESRADKGECSYVSKVCTQGPETRLIGGVSVYAPCWEETYTYSCSHPSVNDCGPLRARGCVQIASNCKQKVGSVCVVYQQTYQCKGEQKTTYSIKGGQTPFCLDGNCRDQSWDSNDELGSALAQLSLLKELQGQFKNPSIFKGDDNYCSKQVLSFKDCCGSLGGWGTDLGLAGCSSQEKLLSQRRKKGLCHFVGTYCAKKVLGQCVTKKSSYCCFGSKLLKVFHEQGRPQIGLGWGEAEFPLCRGFTIEEIQRIDFSKLDLREVFEDLMKTYSPDKLKGTATHLKDRLETIQRGMMPNSKIPSQQRKEG